MTNTTTRRRRGLCRQNQPCPPHPAIRFLIFLMCLLVGVVAAGCNTNNGNSAGIGRPTAAASNRTPSQAPSTSAAPTSPPTTSQSPIAPMPSAKPKPSAPPKPTGPGNYQTTGTVTRVVDGDTVKVTGPARGVVTVRLLGIDSPETKDPREPVQCWGPQATRFAQDTLNGKRVRLFTDPSQDVRDKYGRLLAYVILPGGSNYSVLAARAGAARSYVYSTPVSQHYEIAAAEKEAQNNNSGLWGPPCDGSTNAPQPGPTQAEPPPSTGGLDPRFNTCKEAIAHGDGPYYKGQDPEYDWYFDRDHDGIACERLTVIAMCGLIWPGSRPPRREQHNHIDQADQVSPRRT